MNMHNTDSSPFKGIIADIINNYISLAYAALTERTQRHDYGARQYYLVAPRFTALDPLEEKY